MPDHFDRIAEVHERSEQAISHSEALRNEDERTPRPSDDADPNPYDAADDAARQQRAMERSAAIAKDIWNMGVDAMKGQRGF